MSLFSSTNTLIIKIALICSVILLGLSGLSVVPVEAAGTVKATDAELRAQIAELNLIVAGLEQKVAAKKYIKSENSNFFPESVVFGLTNKSIELLQQILATDPMIYPEGLVTGYFGALTEKALANFQTAYGLPVSRAFDVMTGNVVSEVLTQIPLATYPTNYLQQASVKASLKEAVAKSLQTKKISASQAEVRPVNATPNSARALTSVRATRDYRLNKTTVSVTYQGGSYENFTIATVSPNSAVVSAIAKKIGRPTSEVGAVIVHHSINEKDFERITLNYSTPTYMDITAVHKDGTTEEKAIREMEVSMFVLYVYGGDYEAYEKDILFYVERVRNGEKVDDLNRLVASALGIAEAEVENVLVINLDKNKDDICGGGCGS